jgi:hypothetical protein
MAEHQLPKLTVRVRFPSPAPPTKAQVRKLIRTWALLVPGHLLIFRAINVQLASGDERARRAVVVLVFALLDHDVGIDGARDGLVRAARLVLW